MKSAILVFSVILNLIFVLCLFKKISSVFHYLLFLFGYVLITIIPCARSRIIAYLAQQLFILKRTCKRQRFRLTKTEKLSLMTFGRKIKNNIKYSFILKPETMVKWHRKLIKLHWTYGNKHSTGRPRIPEEAERLIVRLAQENDWGYPKIRGELKKLGYILSESTIKNVLKRYGMPISAKRKSTTTWREFIRHYKELIIASDFLTADTAFFKRFYVLFFMEINSRKIFYAGCTENPTDEWTTQQARHLSWQIQDGNIKAKYLIRDKDSKYTDKFDEVFRTEGIDIIKTSTNAPLQNTFAERFVRSIREECLDKFIVLGQTHLSKIARDYTNYFNAARPHQGIDNKIPEKYNQSNIIKPLGKVVCNMILGGILKDYYRIPSIQSA